MASAQAQWVTWGTGGGKTLLPYYSAYALEAMFIASTGLHSTNVFDHEAN